MSAAGKFPIGVITLCHIAWHVSHIDVACVVLMPLLKRPLGSVYFRFSLGTFPLSLSLECCGVCGGEPTSLLSTSLSPQTHVSEPTSDPNSPQVKHQVTLIGWVDHHPIITIIAIAIIPSSSAHFPCLHDARDDLVRNELAVLVPKLSVPRRHAGKERGLER